MSLAYTNRNFHNSLTADAFLHAVYFLLRHVFVLSQPAGASNSKALPLVLSRTSFSLLHTTLLNTIVTVEIQYIELEHVEHGTCTLLFFQQCLALIPYSKCGNTVPLWSACSFFFLLLYYAIPLLATLTMTSRYCTVLVTVRYYRPVWNTINSTEFLCI